MGIVRLSKMTLYGAAEQQTQVLAQLQELGCAHLIDLGAHTASCDPSDTLNDARAALKYLRNSPARLRQVRRKERFDRDEVVSAALSLQSKEVRLRDERDAIQKSINDLQPWGEFRRPAPESLPGLSLWFYLIPVSELPALAQQEVTHQEITRNAGIACVVVLGADEPDGIPGTRVQLDPRPLSELQRRCEELDELLEDISYQKVGLTRWLRLLRTELAEADDAAARKLAALRVLHGEDVFAVQGWVPAGAAGALRQFAEEQCLALTLEDPQTDEQPPTLLHNPQHLSGSEALMTFYKVPEYRSWDPSVFSFASFAVFFAMIVADAGYGFVLLLLTAYFWKRMGRSSGGQRARSLMIGISALTIVYGVICGSYFGVSPAADSGPGHLVLLDARSQSQMMPLTIGIGVVHLAIAHLVTAWLNRRSMVALASLGWVAVMAGASLAALAMLEVVASASGGWLTRLGGTLLVGGLLLVFLFSSRRPLFSRSPKQHVLRIFEGLQGLTGVSGLFGDALSYLRLFALGLSSAKLSETFNDLGGSAWDSAGLGVIAGIAIVVFGHTLNLALSIMSGVVHGLRLNCIEFYKWGLPEDGHPFKAFAKKAKSR